MLSLSLRNQALAASTLIVAGRDQWEILWAELAASAHPTDRWVAEEWLKPPTVAELRDLHRHVAQTPRQEHKIAAIPFADLLSRETANSLLKVLEEPPTYYWTVLFAESAAVLPTIRSRVRVIQLASTGETGTARQRMGHILAQYTIQQKNEREAARRILQYMPLIHATIQLPVLEEAFQPKL